MGSVIVLSAKRQRKRLQIPVNHEFTGIFISIKIDSTTKSENQLSEFRMMILFQKSTPGIRYGQEA